MKALTVRLHGGLEKYTGMRGQVEVCVPDEASLGAVQEQLGIPKGEVGLFVMNEQLMNEDVDALADSIVDLYPMFAGG